MAKVLFSKPFDKFHGTLKNPSGTPGHVAFTSQKSGAIARTHVVPLNPNSLRQQQIRAVKKTVAQNFRDLTAAQTSGWNNAAAGISRTNILGADYVISGLDLFCMINYYRNTDGQTSTSNVPVLKVPKQPVTLTGIFIISPTVIRITADLTGNEDFTKVQLRFSPPLGSNAKHAPKNSLRLISNQLNTNITLVQSEAIDVTLTNNLFQIPSGSFIGVELLPLSIFYFPGPTLFRPNLIV